MDINAFREYQAKTANKPRKSKFVELRVCLVCGCEYQKNKSYSIARYNESKFCSYKCLGIDKTNKAKLKVRPTKICLQCKMEFIPNKKFSSLQWNQNKFCSPRCSGESRKIKDGLTKGQRHAKKMGYLERGSPEWIDRIKATTKAGMYKPEVQEKIRRPKGPMSDAAKILRSNALVGKMPKNLSQGNGMYGNVQRGTYICSKGDVYFRSKWEANYALYLDFLIQQNQILNWEFEAERFFFEKIKLGTRTYTPDFKVFNNNGTVEYHEVKGHMDSRSKTKLKRMAKCYPEVKLILIRRDNYMDILKKLKGVIKFY